MKKIISWNLYLRQNDVGNEDILKAKCKKKRCCSTQINNSTTNNNILINFLIFFLLCSNNYRDRDYLKVHTYQNYVYEA